MGKYTSKDIQNQVCDLYLNGQSSDDIASLLGCNNGTIINILKRNNIPRRGNSRLGRKNKNSEEKYIPYIGTKYNSLTIISYDKKGITCLCDCGNTKSGYKLCRLKDNSYKTCGCRIRTRGKNHFLWKGSGDVSMRYFSHLVSDAKKRNLEFNISIVYIDELFKQQKGLCKLTKLPILLNDYHKERRLHTASLDRIDSLIGYVEGNVQWVHRDINISKWDFSQERYIEICKLVANNN